MNEMKRNVVPAVVAVVALLAWRLPAKAQHAPQGEHKTVPTAHEGSAAHESSAAHGAAEHEAGPVPPDPHITWPGVMLILILTMFVLAAVIGPVARAHAPPEEPPPAHSHDEPPGASHHHGASGTINPEPDHGHAHH